MNAVSPHEWLHPKLVELVKEAEAAGIARDVSVAVITDLINRPDFNTAAPEDDDNWNQDIGEPDYEANPQTSAADDPDTDAGPGKLENRLQNFNVRRGYGVARRPRQ